MKRTSFVSNSSPHSVSPNIFRRDTCRLCASRSLELVLSLRPTPPANAYVRTKVAQEQFPLDVFLCQTCSHVQLLDVVQPEVLFSKYLYVSGTSPAFVRHFEEYAKAMIERAALAAGSFVIDIGSNDGTFLRFFKQRGFKILGIDPARDLAEAANRNGIDTIPAFFSVALARRVKAEHGEAKLVTANNVFAHADDLHEVAKGVRELLSPDGLFSFEVSYLADVYTKTLFDTIYHEHVSYHTVQPLVRFFKANGLELVDVVRVPTHGGSLRGIVQRQNGPLPVSPAVKQLIELERQLGLNSPDVFRGFAKQIDNIRQELLSLLQRLKSAGKTIAGYGAPAKATTLMYHFGLDADTIEYVVDDSPLKQGWLTPGLHLPILPTEAIYERRPDYLLVLAWNFADTIIKNHARYSAAGGRFIVPLPKVIMR